MEQQQTLQIITLQTHLTHEHYQSYSVLKNYFLQRIHSRTSPATRTLVVLPECTGTWLYLMCVPMPRVFRRFLTTSHSVFLAYAFITHCRAFCQQLYRNYRSQCTWRGLIQQSWFSLFAARSLGVYRQLFAELACETNSMIVAGSTFVQEEGDWHNVSYVFEPEEGSICLQAGKNYPVSDESRFIRPYQPAPAIYSIPNTDIDIGVLICADSWMPRVYELYEQIELVPNRRFLFVIVALNLGQWNMPWSGYDRTVETPGDVKSEHLQSYSLPQAWFHYAVNRAWESLERRKFLQGYGVVCCQGVLNLMNEIRGQGESLIVIKRSREEEKVVLRAEKFDEECLLTCLF